MARFYRGGERDQLFLLATSMRDWLEEGHLAWFVIDAVGRLDLSAFHARHPNEERGRPAYDPSMMLAFVLRVRDRVAILEADRGGVSDRCSVPGDRGRRDT